MSHPLALRGEVLSMARLELQPRIMTHPPAIRGEVLSMARLELQPPIMTHPPVIRGEVLTTGTEHGKTRTTASDNDSPSRYKG